MRRLNSGVIPFAMKIMYESVTVTAQEQHAFAHRLMAMGRRLEERSQRTAEQIERTAGDVFVTGGSNNTCLCVHSRGRLSWAVEPGLISVDRVGVSA